jgi:hypothetical protein
MEIALPATVNGTAGEVIGGFGTQLFTEFAPFEIVFRVFHRCYDHRQLGDKVKREYYR